MHTVTAIFVDEQGTEFRIMRMNEKLYELEALAERLVAEGDWEPVGELTLDRIEAES